MKKTVFILGLIFLFAAIVAYSPVFSAGNYLDVSKPLCPNVDVPSILEPCTSIEMPAPAEFTSGTVEMWVNFTPKGYYNAVMNYGGLVITSESGHYYDLQVGGLRHSKMINYQSLGTWHHIALAWKPATETGKFIGSIYFDGKQCASGTISGWVPPTYLVLGGTVSYNRGQYLLDEFRIWNTCRTGAEITSNIGKTLTGSETGLMTYYNFDDNDTEPFVDRTPNATKAFIRSGGVVKSIGDAWCIPILSEAKWYGANAEILVNFNGDYSSNYQMQLSAVPDFATIAYSTNSIGNYAIAHSTELDPAKSYFARIRKINAPGDTGLFSAPMLVPSKMPHPGNAFIENTNVYWTEKEKFALGSMLSYSSDFTIESWVQRPSVLYNGSGGLKVSISYTTCFITAGKVSKTFRTELPKYAQYHFAVSYIAAEHSFVLYVNGKEMERIVADESFIGSDSAYSNGGSYYLDDYRVWSRAKSAGDIQQQMYINPSPDAANLLSYFDYNESLGYFSIDKATRKRYMLSTGCTYVPSISEVIMLRPASYISTDGFAANWYTSGAFANMRMQISATRDFAVIDTTMKISVNSGSFLARYPLRDNKTCYYRILADVEGLGTIATMDSVIHTVSNGKRYYVKQLAFGNNDGSSWEHAFAKLQDAIAAASAGDTIVVATGKYVPGSTAISKYLLKSDITILGGYDGINDNLSVRDVQKYRTIISGDISGDDKATINGISDTVVGTNCNTLFEIPYKYNNVLLDGLVFTGASAYGGIKTDGNNIRITNCIVAGNSGNGISCEGGTLDIADCQISKNAGWALNVNYGRLKMTRTIIADNYDNNNSGAGLVVSQHSYADQGTYIENCEFRNNYSKHDGAALLMLGFEGLPLIVRNCIFEENSAATGSAFYSSSDPFGSYTPLLFDNCIFAKNANPIKIDEYGDTPAGEMMFSNCTFVNNSGISYFSYCWLQNTIVTGTDIEQTGLGANTKFINCLLPFASAAGNITGDPLFADVSEGDYRLAENSPCIDAGTSALDPNRFQTVDFAGNPRMANCRIDIGAFEYLQSGGQNIYFASQPQDLVACTGGNAVFSAEVAGNVVKYFWTLGTDTLPASDSSVLVLASIAVRQNLASLRCHAISACGDTIASLPAVLTVEYASPVYKSVSPVSQSVCRGNSVKVKMLDGFISYQWNNGQNNGTIEVQNTGDYIVTLTDGRGCRYTDTTKVTVWELPVVKLADTKGCTNAPAILDAGNHTSYKWSDGTSMRTISLNQISQSKQYTVTVTNEKGCTSVSNPATVVIYPAAVPVITGGTVCAGTAFSITPEKAYIDYKWSNASTADKLILSEVTQSGDYSLTVQDEYGCTGISNIATVKIHPLPEINAGEDIVAHYTVPFNLSGTVLSATDYSASWSPGIHMSDSTLLTPEISMNKSQIFTLTATDANGCKSKDMVTVNVAGGPLSVEIQASATSFCQGEVAVLTALATGGAAPELITYKWINLTSNIAYAPEKVTDIHINSAGWYKVIASDGYLTAVDSVEITVFSQPEVALASSEKCEGEFIQLQAPKGLTKYAWSNGDQSSGIIISQSEESGSYAVTVTDANGCSTISDTVQAIIHARPAVYFADTGSCAGTDFIISAPAGYQTYRWSNGGQTSQLVLSQASQSGSYSLAVTDIYGCTGVSNIFRADYFAKSSIRLFADTAIAVCSRMIFDVPALAGATEVLWSMPMLNLGEGLFQTNKITALTQLSVQMTDANGCKSTDTMMIDVFVPHIAVESISAVEEITALVGQTVKINPVILPFTASNRGYILTSNNAKVAFVTDSNTVVAKSLGNTQLVVLANDNGKFRFINFTVLDKAVQLQKVNIQTELSLVVGESMQISQTFVPADATNKLIDWNTSNNNIVVNESGVVTALTSGSAKVFGYVDALDAQFAVRVNVRASYSPELAQLPTLATFVGTPSLSINLNRYIADDNTSPLDIIWTLRPSAHLSVNETGGNLTIGMTDKTWIGRDSVMVIAADADGYADSSYMYVDISPEPNHAPAIAALPEVSARLGTAFDPVDLLRFISDDYTAADALALSILESYHLTGQLAGTLLSVGKKDALWYGRDSLLLTVTDADGVQSQAYMYFTISAEMNTAPVIADIPIQEQKYLPFADIDLKQYVYDDYTLSEHIVWQVTPSGKVLVTITADNVAQITVLDNSWVGYDHLSFIAIDREGLSDTATVIFAQRQARAWYAKPYIQFTAERPRTGVNVPITFRANMQGAQSWHWEFEGGETLDNTALEPSVTYSQPGKYAVKLWAMNNVGADSLSIEGYVEVVGISPVSQIVCRGTQAKLTVSNTRLTYLWSNGATSSEIDIAPVSDTTLYLTVTDGQFQYMDQIRLILAPELSIPSNGSICAGQKLKIGQEGFTTYRWSNGSESAFIDIDAKGQYTLTATDPNGCVSVSSFTLDTLFTLPQVDLGGDAQLCDGDILALEVPKGVVSFAWNDGSTFVTRRIEKPGTYILSVTDEHNCVNADTAKVGVYYPYMEKIGVATASKLDEYVIIAWERSLGKRTMSYEVYRSEVHNGEETWVRFDSLSFDSLSVSIDRAADYKRKAYRYSLVTIDSCGNRSGFSPAHTTMHLQIDSQTGNGQAQLSWTPYVGANPLAYIIYEAKPDGTIDSIDYTLGDAQSYNILQHQNGRQYRVGIQLPETIRPAVLKSDSGPFSQSMSNLSEAISLGRQIGSEYLLTAYPNPVSQLLSIALPDEVTGELTIAIQNMQGISATSYLVPVRGSNLQMPVAQLPAGAYCAKFAAQGQAYTVLFVKE